MIKKYLLIVLSILCISCSENEPDVPDIFSLDFQESIIDNNRCIDVIPSNNTIKYCIINDSNRIICHGITHIDFNNKKDIEKILYIYGIDGNFHNNISIVYELHLNYKNLTWTIYEE